MRRAKHKRSAQRLTRPEPPKKQPFIEHLYELRRRLFYVVLSVGLWATAAYFVQMHIVAALLKPAANQEFIYTSVGGGIDFLFRLCLSVGIVFSIPVIIYQFLKYLEPLIKKDAVRFMMIGSAVSGVLALLGMAFGYFVGLPAALHFLLHQFTTSDQIQPLLTIQSYMSFVTLYMVGSALIFQLPLILVLINRIKPLKPKKLLSMERWVILIAFILGGIINPSPRVQDQVMLAGPIILTYQIGVLIVWITNRRKQRPGFVTELIAKDKAVRAEREAKFREARARFAQRAASAMQPAFATAAASSPELPAQSLSSETQPKHPAPRRANPGMPPTTGALDKHKRN